MLLVKDGDKTLQFNGTLLAKSTSERKGAQRWIEFELYRTDSGSFILSRVGVSLIFHGAACPMVVKYRLTESPNYDLDSRAVPCEECEPGFDVDLVFPEKYRHWAMVTEDPEEVLDALHKYDRDTDSYYLTSVAKRLLEKAAEVDLEIKEVYTVEIIP